MNLCDLILDIKILIASFDEIAWYNLYRVDDEFRQYVRTEEGCARFIDLATIDEYECDEYGCYYTSKKIFGIIHYQHINDIPAVIYDEGTQAWYKNGKLHRERDLPALVNADGNQEWYKNGKIHRDGDFPAIIYADGTQWWFKDGNCHRIGRPSQNCQSK